jgi:subtilisin family serine protease
VLLKAACCLCLVLIACCAIPGLAQAAAGRLQQLPYSMQVSDEPGLPRVIATDFPEAASAPEIPNRRIPERVLARDLNSPGLDRKSVPLPQANTRGDWHYRQRKFGRALTPEGRTIAFAPETLLVKFKGNKHVSALRVEAFREIEALEAVGARGDVEFAELNVLQERQFSPNDLQLAQQWHHALLGSFSAWQKSLGSSAIKIGIVDTPFQMDHPDLAANTIPGWSVVTNVPITAHPGIDHSTLSAGMAAAVIHNGLGVAGAGNCAILPIHINGFTDEIYSAIIWAADHGVRVVNVSWSGADKSTLNEAGLYLKEAGGLLAMAGINGSGSLNYPNHPHIYSISMTDAADNPQSKSGPHIDFAAPGYAVFTTATGSGYATGTGTSYATPLFAGIVAVLWSINPTLSPEEVVELLKTTADDKGAPGWDPFFGWGRIHFGRAAAAAQASLPRIVSLARGKSGLTLTANYRPGLDYSLWKSSNLNPPEWIYVTDGMTNAVQEQVVFSAPYSENPSIFYRIVATPR